MVTVLALFLLALHCFLLASPPKPSIYINDDTDASDPTEQVIAETVSTPGFVWAAPSEDDYRRMTVTLTKYAQIVSQKSQEEQYRLLVDTIPLNLTEALDLFVRQVLLYQEIYAEQLAVLEDMDANPQDHVVLAEYFERTGQPALANYEDAQTHTAWCNLLIRYAGWIARNPKKRLDHVDRLYEMFYNLYRIFMDIATEGFDHLFQDLPGMERINSSGITWMLCKLRETYIPRSTHIRHTVWFHDDCTPALRFFSRGRLTLLPFITQSTKKRLEWNSRYKPSMPPQFMLLANGYRSKAKRMFESKSQQELTFQDVRAVWAEIFKMPGFNILRHWEDESVTDRDFERSFMRPLGSLPPTPEPVPASQSVPTADQRGEVKKSRNKKRKEKEQEKRRQRQREQQKNSKSGPSLKPPSPSDVEAEEDEDISDPIESVVIAEIEIGPSSPPIASPIETVSGPSKYQAIPCEVEHLDSQLESSSSDDTVSGKAEDKEAQAVESWEDEMVRDREHFALEKKKKAQDRKIIHQQKTAQEKSARQARLRRNMQTGPAKSNFKLGIDSTELCLAFPDAFKLFLSNDNVCTTKAKSYRWIFDPDVVIKQEHMDFLCNLFNVEGGKGQLNFLDMIRTYWAIETCLRRRRNDGLAIDLKRTVFKWSHRFEINKSVVIPLQKEVHCEHASSRFNHEQAHALFSGGGFDPRFFIPQYQ